MKYTVISCELESKIEAEINKHAESGYTLVGPVQFGVDTLGDNVYVATMQKSE